MSHDAHAGDGHPMPPLPATGGISMGVKLLVVLGVVIAIVQGSFVGMSSGFGRVWPASASATIPLPPKNF